MRAIELMVLIQRHLTYLKESLISLTKLHPSLVYYFHSLKKNAELVSGGTGQMSEGLFLLWIFMLNFQCVFDRS